MYHHNDVRWLLGFVAMCLTACQAIDTSPEQVGVTACVADDLHKSALSACDRSDWRGALQAWERRLAVEESRENRVGLAETLHCIGYVHTKRGDYLKALESYERSLKLSETLDDRASVAASAQAIANLRRDINYD